MESNVKTAFYPGSFNPFTAGHQSIVDRALKLVDKIVIAIGTNPGKPNDNATERLQNIERLYAGNPRVKAIIYSGLTVEAAKETGATFILRGIRGVADYELERTLAETNLRISGMETLLMPALPELSMVSSSMVRELGHFGYDVTQFLPVKEK